MPSSKIALLTTALAASFAVSVTTLHTLGSDPAQAVANPVEWQQQVIYLVFPDRFENGDPSNDRLGIEECFDPTHLTRFHGGDWAGIEQRMDYLQELGVTAIWATPVYKQIGVINDSCGYHGYWADFTFPDDGAVEPKLGTEADLARMIQTLHDHDMKFILDQVVNHTGYDAQLTRQRPEWFNPMRPACELLGDPDVFCDLAGLPDFDFRNADAVDYTTRQSLSWLERFNLDGIRMDTVKHVPASYFRNIWIPLVNQESPDIFTVGELLDQFSLERLHQFLETGFDSTFNFPLQRAMVESFAKGGSVDQVAETAQATWNLFGSDALMLTNLIDNHDIPRFTNEPGFGVPEAEIRDRYFLALGTMFSLPGIPQLFYGNELGMYGGADPDNRRDMPEWAWTAEGRSGSGGSGEFLPNPQGTFSYVQKLIDVRQENAALHSGYYAELWRQNGSQNPDVYAFFRGLGENRVVVVVNNGALPSGPITIPIQANTALEPGDRAALGSGAVLEELLGIEAPTILTVGDNGLTVDLPAKTIGIYRHQ
ncbi:MAG: alpha-amylase family glycosyl hydrolase [Leptolyngbyaceae bacterium]|nr:alpha-amylase family glycosyl hydrolase [Leptolyngbyaceae bacterium]